MADKKEKPNWSDIVNTLINFGLLLVAVVLGIVYVSLQIADTILDIILKLVG